MIGDYTELTLIAPSSAQEGSTVDIVVTIKNILDYTIYASPVVDINGSILEGSYETITPEETKSWSFSFIMLSSNVLLIVSSWCESAYFDWQKDCFVEQAVLVPSVAGSILGSVVTLMIIVMMMSMLTKTMEGI